MAGHETDNVESKSVQQSDNTGDSGVGQQISQAQNDGSYQQTFQNQQAETAKASEQMAKDGTLGQMSIGGMDGQNANGAAGKDGAAAQGAENKDGGQADGGGSKDGAAAHGAESKEGRAADGGSKDSAGTKSVEANNQNPMDSKSNTDDMVTTAPGDSGTANDHQPQSNDAPGNAPKSDAETRGLGADSSNNSKSDSNVDPGPPPSDGDNQGAAAGSGDSKQINGSDSASQQGSGPMMDSNGNPMSAGQDGGPSDGNHSPHAGGDANGGQAPHAGGDANGQSAPGGGQGQGGDKNGSKSESTDQGTPSYDALGNYQGPFGDANNANPNEQKPNSEKPNTQGEQSPMGTMQDHMDSMKQPAGPGDNLNYPPMQGNTSEAGANNKMDGYTTTGGMLTDTSEAIITNNEKSNQMDMSPKNGSAEGMDNKQMQGNDQSENHSKHNQDHNQKAGDADMKKNGEANQENNESKPNQDRNRGGGSGFGRPTSAGRSAVPANSPRW